MSSFFSNIENEAIYFTVYIIEFNKALIDEIIKNNKTPSTKLSHDKHINHNRNGINKHGSGRNVYTDHRNHNNPPKKMEEGDESPKYIGNNDISMKPISNPFTD